MQAGPGDLGGYKTRKLGRGVGVNHPAPWAEVTRSRESEVRPAVAALGGGFICSQQRKAAVVKAHPFFPALSSPRPLGHGGDEAESHGPLPERFTFARGWRLQPELPPPWAVSRPG